MKRCEGGVGRSAVEEISQGNRLLEATACGLAEAA